jgi:hypothetical protein
MPESARKITVNLLFAACMGLVSQQVFANPDLFFQSASQTDNKNAESQQGLDYVPPARPGMSTGQFNSGISTYNQQSMQQMNQESRQQVMQQMNQVPPASPPSLQKATDGSGNEGAVLGGSTPPKKQSSGIKATPPAYTAPAATAQPQQPAQPAGGGSSAPAAGNGYTGFQAASPGNNNQANAPATGEGLGIKY